VKYAEHRVRPSLAARVECIWVAEDDDPGPAPPERVLPDGCVEWIFHFGAPYSDDSGGGASVQPRSLVVGPMIRPMRIAATGPVSTLGVRFRPGGAAGLLPVPLEQLTGRTADTRDLWGADGRRIEDAVTDARSLGERLEALERFLDARRDRLRAVSGRLSAAVAFVLARRGRASVDAIAAFAGCSPRQLERDFRARVGLSPKGLSRIARFQNVLRLSRARGRAPWAEIAARCGYADQAHLIREFRDLAGVSPASGDAADGALARYFVDPARLEALFSGEPAAVGFVQDAGAPPP
jgi:AraC-like DNA-binding protein